jgi:hypothetical protein
VNEDEEYTSEESNYDLD